MAIVLETTLGDITIDLFIKERPRACMNFLKLCKMKYYNFNLFHTIQHDFLAQTGDPTGSGTGGESIWGVLEGPLKRYYESEDQPKLRHTNVGTVSLVGNSNNMLGSQFFITLSPELVSLDGKHCVFGEVSEGFEVLRKLNEAICDEDHRPYQDVRITHTVILEDPYPNPDYFIEPPQSPEPTAERLQGGRIAADEEIDETVGKTAQELAEMAAEREAKARATILEMVGDIPHADVAPPENVLFVCKLNPVTSDDDLEIIFSRFGKIVSCEVIRDKITGDSLQYAFIEFSEQKSCEDAYFKMDNVLIDDRRIHVDFSQSVAKVKWLGRGRLMYYDNEGKRLKEGDKNIGHGEYKKKRIENNGKVKSQKNDDKPRDNPRDRDKREYHQRDNKNYREKDRYDSRREREYYDSRKNSYSDRNKYQNDKRSYEDWKYRTSGYERNRSRDQRMNRGREYNTRYQGEYNPRYNREKSDFKYKEDRSSSKYDERRSNSRHRIDKVMHRDEHDNRKKYEKDYPKAKYEDKNVREKNTRRKHKESSSESEEIKKKKKDSSSEESSSEDTKSSEEEKKRKSKKNKKKKLEKKKSNKKKRKSSTSDVENEKETKKCKKRRRNKSRTDSSESSSSSSSDSDTPKKKHKK